MHVHDEIKTKHGIRWVIRFDHGHVSIIVRNLTTGERRISERDYSFSFRDGYNVDDVLEIYRELDEYIEELSHGE